MDALDDDCGWEFLDCSFLDDDAPAANLFLSCQSAGADAELSTGTDVLERVCIEKECSRKRGRLESCSKPGPKACRERRRREKLNDRFQDLSAVLEPERPAKTDKPAILDDAIRVLNQLKKEARELRESNSKLVGEIKALKAEKNELRDEKLMLKAQKEKVGQQLKAMSIPSAAFIPNHPVAYHANKMAVFPSYGYLPMWQYMPASVRETSKDHELWPPAA